jgi:hypothetical protein
MRSGRTKRALALAGAAAAAVLAVSGVSGAEPQDAPGQAEFGLTERELVQHIEKVEALIARCMRAQGFEYVAVDSETVRRGMKADKTLPGLEEAEFVAKYGFGISTHYTGKPPQLSDGYSPGKIGLGRRNVQVYQNLSPADQVAYSRALFGENSDATFAIALDAENFARCGGCTREAVEQVFSAEHLKATYINPKDALVARDPRMRAALREYAAKMREAGFDSTDPNLVEEEIRQRLDQITGGSSVPLEELSPEQLAALQELQDHERRLAMKNLELEIQILEPIEERIEKELFARRVE